MGIITISRIATQIIAVFSMDRTLEDQFEFFNDVRFFPETIYACINKPVDPDELFYCLKSIYENGEDTEIPQVEWARVVRQLIW